MASNITIDEFARQDADRAAKVQQAVEQARVEAQPLDLVAPEETATKQTFYDTKTGKPKQVETAQDFVEGNVEPDKDQYYNVVGPDGTTKGVKGSDLALALNRGYRLEGGDEAYVRTSATAASPLEVAAKHAASAFSFGATDKLNDDPRQAAIAEAEDKLHPTAAMVGSGLGLAGSLATGGPLFDAAESIGKAATEATGLASKTSALGKLASTAVKGGVEGAIISAPQAVTEAALGDPQQAGESALIGAFGGAALGTMGHLLGSAIASVGDKISTKAMTERLTNDIGHENLASIGERFGAKPEELLDQAQSVGIARNPGEEAADYAARLGQKQNALNDDVANVLSQVDHDVLTAKQGYDPHGLMEDIQSRVEQGAKGKIAKVAAREEMEQFAGSFAKKQMELGADPNASRATLAGAWKAAQDLEEGPVKRAVEQAIVDRAPMIKPQVINRDLLASASDGATNMINAQKKATNLSLSSVLHAPSFTGGLKAAALGVGYSALTGHEVDPEHLAEEFALGAIGAHGLKGTLVKRLKEMALEQGTGFLARYNNQLGLAVAHAAQGEAQSAIQRIPSMLREGRQVFSRAVASAPTNVFRMLGATSSDAQTAAKQASENISKLVSDPNAIAKHVDRSVGLLRDGAPNVAQSAGTAATTALTYLASVAPKEPPPVPFAPQQPWKPTKDETRAMAARLEVINDPYVVVKRVADGTLRKEHVEALNAVYPATADQIRTAVMDAGLGVRARTLSPSKRAKLEMLVPGSDPNAVTRLKTNQQAFAGGVPVQDSMWNLGGGGGSGTAPVSPPGSQGPIRFKGGLPGALDGKSGKGMSGVGSMEFRDQLR